MGNGRGSWNQHYRDSTNDKAQSIQKLEEEKEIKEKIESLRKSIKNDEIEMYD